MKNVLKKHLHLVFIFAILVVACFCVGTARPQFAQAAPFSCNIGFYQVMSGQLKLLDPSTGNYMNLGPTSDATNAMGYNTEDNHIYALGTVSGDPHLFRYEHDGTVTDLGQPTGLPTTSYVAGDFDDQGNLWVRPFAAGDTIWSIDVSANTATSLTTSINTFVSELVFIDGILYGLNGPALTRIDISDGTTNFTNVPELVGTVPNLSAMGAGWTTVDKELYFTWNTNGVIYRIDDYTTGNTPSATPVLQGEIPNGSNDGASCPNATSPIPGVGANDDSYTLHLVNGRTLNVPTATGTLSNDTGDSISVTDYTQPANGTVTLNADGSFTYTANPGFKGVDTFTYTISDVFDLTSSATVTITVNETSTTDPSDDMLVDTGTSQLTITLVSAGLLALGLGIFFKYRLA